METEEHIRREKGILSSLKEHPLAAFTVALGGMCMGTFWAGRTTGTWNYFSTPNHLVWSELGALGAIGAWYIYSRIAASVAETKFQRYLRVDALTYLPFLFIGLYILYSTRMLSHVFFPMKLDRLLILWAIGVFIGLKVVHILYFYMNFTGWLFCILAVIVSFSGALFTIGDQPGIAAVASHPFYMRWQAIIVLLYLCKYTAGAFFQKRYFIGAIALVIVVGAVLTGSQKFRRGPNITQALTSDTYLKYLPAAHNMKLIPDEVEKSFDTVRVKVAGESRNALYLPAPAKIEVPIELKGPSNIFLGVSMLPPSFGGRGDGVLFRFSLKPGSGEPELITTKYIDPKSLPEDRKWHDLHLDLSKFATGPAKLIIETAGSAPRSSSFKREPDTRDDIAILSEPLLYELAYERGVKPDVFIILLDALRFDHMGVYGYKRPITPNIDALAADSVVFEQAEAPASWTLGSVASLFTGLFPYKHGGISIKFPSINADARTLAQYLKSSGYINGFFSASPVLGDLYNYGKGFHFYNNGCSAFQGFASSGCVTETFLPWLENAPAAPLFGYIHYFDPHAPYNAPAPFKGKFSMSFKGVRPLVAAGEINDFDQQAAIFKEVDLTETELKHIIALYDEEIEYVDSEVGKIISRLKKMGIYRDSLIIILADHGEAFMEHGRLGHGQSLKEVLTHIPLIIKLPGNESAGKRIDNPVGLTDILPTVLEAAGITPPEHDGAISLMGVMRGQHLAERDLFFHRGAFMGPPLYAVRRGDAKFFIGYKMDRKSRIEALYDLSVDPNERENIINEEPELAASLRKSLEAYIEESDRRGKGRKMDKRLKHDLEMQRNLRANGYVGGK